MDSLAKQAALQNVNSNKQRPTYSTTKLGLYTSHGMYIKDLHEYMQYVITANPMIEYLLKKNKWSLNQLQMINWKALEMALKSYKPFRQTRLAQLMHDWQHTGDRILLMAEGKADCPTKCGMIESKLHYLYCKDRDMQKGRAKIMTTLVQQLKCLRTYPGIITSLQKILRDGFSTCWWQDIQEDSPVDKILKETIEYQSKLGDASVPKGYMIKEWATVQQKWEITSNLPQSKYRWSKEIITSIHTYVYDSWKLRNEIIHGKSEKSRKAIERQEL